MDTNNFLRDKFENYEIIAGEKAVEKPEMVKFINWKEAIAILDKHIRNGVSKIKIHGDVDVDGIGSTYIADKFLYELGCKGRVSLCINSTKVHGVNAKHIVYFNKSSQDLVIIVDSSSNDIDYIKEFNCDVIVIDHHDVEKVNLDRLTGDTAGGKYVIVNNTVDNIEDGYKADDRMSCGLVIYELFRVYQYVHNLSNIVEKTMLYQWVGVTLFTDSVPLDTARNQWYIEKTVHNMDCEPGLHAIMKSISKFQCTLDKGFIQFNLAPLFNRAIRAGYSATALDLAVRNPGNSGCLMELKPIQAKIQERFKEGMLEYSNYCIQDLTNSDIAPSYYGLLATKCVEYTEKSTITYKIIKGNIAKGSFRGKYEGLDYLSKMKELVSYAQGHKKAFGFEIEQDKIHEVMSELVSIEANKSDDTYVTAGDLLKIGKGKYHIDNMDEFKRQGLLWKLAIVNGKLSTEEAVNLIIENKNFKPSESYDKYMVYDIYGLRCIAYEELTTEVITVYAEFTKELKCYARNKTR